MGFYVNEWNEVVKKERVLVQARILSIDFFKIKVCLIQALAKGLDCTLGLLLPF